MGLKKQIAKVEIKKDPKDPKSLNISIETPIWKSEVDTGFIVDLKLFGIQTFVNNKNEIDEAISEMLTVFFHTAQSSGKGIHAELKSLGWEPKKQNLRYRTNVNKTIKKRIPSENFNIPSSPVLENLLHGAPSRKVQLSV